MFLVMGITGKVGGATAEHLLAHGKEVRALVRNREKASSWANQGVELVDGDWNDSAAIERALKGVEGAFVMLPAVWAPSPDYKEAKGVIANYVEALTKAAPPRVVALSSMGANRTSGLGMITALSLLEQGFRDLISPIAFVRAGGFFENFLYGLQVAQGGTLPVYYNPTNRKSTMVATNDIGTEVATLLTGPAWSGQRVVELGSMVTSDEVAKQLGEVLNLDVKAFAVPRAGWAEAFEQFGIPKGHTGPAEEMFEAVNAGWMDLGLRGYGARSGYDVRTRCIRGCTERRQGVSPGRIRMRRRLPASASDASREARCAANYELSRAEDRSRFTTYPAIIVAALVGGLWPGIFATVLSAVAAWYLAIPQFFARPGRRETVEHPFGTIKQWMNQGAFLMRGLRRSGPSSA